jgi:hypothetical protein
MELFTQQVTRLRSTFGQKFYPDERVQTIWKSLSDMTDGWFEKLVTDFISNSRNAPLPSEFMVASEIERKKNYATHFPTRDEIETYPDSVFSKDEIVEFFQVMKALASGKMTRKEGAEYSKIIYRMLHQRKKFICRRCEDIGVLFRRVNGAEYTWRCSCARGLARSENWSSTPLRLPGSPVFEYEI